MKKIFLALLLLSALALYATPAYYPMTTLAEAFVSDGNANCNLAYTSLATVLGATNRSEFISCRLYHSSGALSPVSVEDRYYDYNVSAVPTVIFNGGISIVGPSQPSTYQNMVDAFKYSASPLRVHLDGWAPATGALEGYVEMYDTTLALTGANLVLMVMENNVDGATYVTRQVLTQDFSLTGQGAMYNFNSTFTYDASWNTSNMWAIACVQLDNGQILQSSSTLPLPAYNVRCAMDWNNLDLVAGLPMNSFNSLPLWFYNTGNSDNWSVQLVLDDTPADWYFNYCDEDGNCYPGNTPLSVPMGAGDHKAFHLNLYLGSTGIAYFHYQITSPNLGTFTVPFIVRSSDYVANDDQILTPELALSNNHPNPFRGATTFTVNAEKAGSSASVQIFNLKGQKVAETPLQSLQQGANSIAWSAPQDLAAGIYFYRLSGSQTSLRRMLLLK